MRLTKLLATTALLLGLCALPALANNLANNNPPAPTEAVATKAAPLKYGVQTGDARSATVEVGKSTIIQLEAQPAAVMIADPTVAEIMMPAPDSIMIIGQRVGSTNILITSPEQNRAVANYNITVSENLSGLRQALQQSLPKNQIQVSSVPGGIVLQGDVRSASEVEQARRIATRFVSANGEVINQIRISGATQVYLRVRVAEVSRAVSKQLGVNWETFGALGNATLGLATGAQMFLPIAAADRIGNFGPTGVINRPGGRNALHFGDRWGRMDINGTIDALATEGLVTVLAEPSLTALSGETASFLAGGEFPVPIPQGNGTISVSYRQYGISLSFTPTITADGQVSMRVRPEVSQLSTAGAVTIDNLSVPALTTRRAETTIELGSGQSFAIAGLLQNNTNQDISKFPFLGDLPILGQLFRSDSFRRDETELVILVTPYLVRPNSERLATPQEGLVAPSDAERLLMGRQVGAKPVNLDDILPPPPKPDDISRNNDADNMPGTGFGNNSLKPKALNGLHGDVGFETPQRETR